MKLDYARSKTPLVMIAVELKLKNSLSNMRRNPLFAKAYEFFYTRLLEVLLPEPNCLEIKQLGNQLMILWDGSEDGMKTVFKHYFLFQEIKEHTGRTYPDAKLDIAIAMDMCLVPMVVYADAGPKVSPIFLHSDLWERVTKILSCIPEHNQRLFMTHAVRSALPPYMQDIFSKSYYFYHICCYARDEKKTANSL